MVRRKLLANHILLSTSGEQNYSCSPSPPLPPLLFFCTLKFFVRVPSILWFSAMLKHFHASAQIELLGLSFKKNKYLIV